VDEPTNPATPAGDIQRECDTNHTTQNEGVHSCKRFYADTPVQAIEVTASVKVSKFSVERHTLYAELHIELSVDHGESDMPYRWSVVYTERASTVLKGLEEYLGEYCPAPDEVLETLRSVS
jgi:hypothetical protein